MSMYYPEAWILPVCLEEVTEKTTDKRGKDASEFKKDSTMTVEFWYISHSPGHRAPELR